MSGPIRGSIEHYGGVVLATSASLQDIFVSIYNFLNSNGSTLGIERVCYNTGSTPTGAPAVRGMNRYDSASCAGPNAFAVFTFKSASLPWTILIQWCDGSTNMNTAPGAPGLLNGSAVNSGLGIAVAQNSNGSLPWAGTQKNTPNASGSASKAGTVWNSGSAFLSVWPRSNVSGGATTSARQNMMQLFAASSTNSYRLQMVADYDNLAILIDESADNTYVHAFMFGKYVPLTGSSTAGTYFGVSGVATTFPQTAMSVLSTTAGTGTGGYEGGVAFPSASVTRTVKNIMFDRLSGLVNTSFTAYHPNKTFSSASYTEFPLIVVTNETNEEGYLGMHNEFFREVYNTAVHDTNIGGTRCAFASSLTLATVKITIPWHSGTAPGSGTTRGGVQWGNP